MQIALDNTTYIFLLICLLTTYILLQIYLLIKLKFFIERISEIFFKVNSLINELQVERGSGKPRNVKNCQNCKNRLVFFHSQDKPYFYIKCRLNNQPVNPDYYCEHFVFDPQNYEI